MFPLNETNTEKSSTIINKHKCFNLNMANIGTLLRAYRKGDETQSQWRHTLKMTNRAHMRKAYNYL